MKTRLKKYTASLLLAVAAASMLAACGGGAGSTASSASTDAIQNVLTGSTVTLDGSTVAIADGVQTYHWKANPPAAAPP